MAGKTRAVRWRANANGVECGAATEDGTAWKAMLTVGDEDAEDAEEVAVYCPAYAAREFSES